MRARIGCGELLLQGASGAVTRTEVVGIRRNQRSEGHPEGTPRGCQEGIAIEVRTGMRR